MCALDRRSRLYKNVGPKGCHLHFDSLTDDIEIDGMLLRAKSFGGYVADLPSIEDYEFMNGAIIDVMLKLITREFDGSYYMVSSKFWTFFAKSLTWEQNEMRPVEEMRGHHSAICHLVISASKQ